VRERLSCSGGRLADIVRGGLDIINAHRYKESGTEMGNFDGTAGKSTNGPRYSSLEVLIKIEAILAEGV